MPADSASLDLRATERRPWLPHWLTSESPFPWLFPAAALMVVFGIYPLLYAVTLSLYKKNAATRKMVFDPTHNWTKILADDWTAVTRDKSLSAQFEHTILVTETGFEVLTLSAGARQPPDWLALPR